MGVKVVKSFVSPKKRPRGVAWVDGKIWLVGKGSKKVSGLEETYGGAHRDVRSPIKNPMGLTWDGKEFLLCEEGTKTVYKITDTGESAKVLDLKEVKFGKLPPILQSDACLVTDLAWGRNALWVTCMAGYSSSVYRVDIKNKKAIGHFFAHGPKPRGISFDTQEKNIWIIDESNREFRKFSTGGEWKKISVPSPVEKPRGLSLDSEDNFWTSDRKTGKIYKIKGGE